MQSCHIIINNHYKIGLDWLSRLGPVAVVSGKNLSVSVLTVSGGLLSIGLYRSFVTLVVSLIASLQRVLLNVSPKCVVAQCDNNAG